MKIKDLPINKMAIVTHGTSCGTFQRGDKIIRYQNGDIGNATVHGWLERDGNEKWLNRIKAEAEVIE